MATLDTSLYRPKDLTNSSRTNAGIVNEVDPQAVFEDVREGNQQQQRAKRLDEKYVISDVIAVGHLPLVSHEVWDFGV